MAGVDPDPFTWADFQRFYNMQLEPLMKQVKEDQEENRKAFHELNETLSQIHTTMKVSTSVNTALTTQAEKFNEKAESLDTRKIQMWAVIISIVMAFFALTTFLFGVFNVLSTLKIIRV